MVLYPNKLPESERVCSGICTNNKPQILRLTIRKIFIYRKAVAPHVYTNIKNVLSFREARNLGVKILTARHSDIE